MIQFVFRSFGLVWAFSRWSGVYFDKWQIYSTKDLIIKIAMQHTDKLYPVIHIVLFFIHWVYHKLTIWSFAFLLILPTFYFESNLRKHCFSLQSGRTAFCCCKDLKSRRLGLQELHRATEFCFNSRKDHAEYFLLSNLTPDTRWEIYMCCLATMILSIEMNLFKYWKHILVHLNWAFGQWLFILNSSEWVLWCENVTCVMMGIVVDFVEFFFFFLSQVSPV